MPRTCIYCRGAGGPFRSVEHVVPESLGNHNLVLPRGVVCDRCNNGVLAWLDGQLVTFEPVAMLRALRAVPSKKGRHKRFVIPGLEVFREKGGGVRVRYEIPDDRPASGTPGPIETTFTQRMDEKLASSLARALLKQMLGGMYLDHGRKFVLQGRYDSLRDVILGDAPYSGLLAFKKNLDIGGFERGPGGFRYDFVSGMDSGKMWVEGRFLGLSMLATWGLGSDELELAGAPPTLKDQFDFIEVDPAFGVR